MPNMPESMTVDVHFICIPVHVHSICIRVCIYTAAGRSGASAGSHERCTRLLGFVFAERDHHGNRDAFREWGHG